jgi:hypothetical protein
MFNQIADVRNTPTLKMKSRAFRRGVSNHPGDRVNIRRGRTAKASP